MGFKQAIVVRADLGMGKGKISSQAAHASLLAYEKSLKQNPGWVEEWHASGMTKIVLRANNKNELLEIFEKAKKVLPAAMVKDAGKTQIEAGEPTSVGIGPAPDNEIDKFTKHLRLL